jgi:hypothetical protein
MQNDSSRVDFLEDSIHRREKMLHVKLALHEKLLQWLCDESTIRCIDLAMILDTMKRFSSVLETLLLNKDIFIVS